MKLETLRYGTIHIAPEDIIDFPEGLLGFPNCKKYTLIDQEDVNPFRVLQSIDTPSLAFVVIDPVIVHPSYHFKLTLNDIKIIKADSVDKLSVYCIVSLSKNVKEATINMQGPLVINTETKLGHQFILFEETYSVNAKLIDSKLIKNKDNSDSQGVTDKSRSKSKKSVSKKASVG